MRIPHRFSLRERLRVRAISHRAGWEVAKGAGLRAAKMGLRDERAKRNHDKREKALEKKKGKVGIMNRGLWMARIGHVMALARKSRLK